MHCKKRIGSQSKAYQSLEYKIAERRASVHTTLGDHRERGRARARNDRFFHIARAAGALVA